MKMKIDHDQTSDRGKVAGIGMLMEPPHDLSTLDLPPRRPGAGGEKLLIIVTDSRPRFPDGNHGY